MGWGDDDDIHSGAPILAYAVLAGLIEAAVLIALIWSF
jgi:hypothetical protein